MEIGDTIFIKAYNYKESVFKGYILSIKRNESEGDRLSVRHTNGIKLYHGYLRDACHSKIVLLEMRKTKN